MFSAAHDFGRDPPSAQSDDIGARILDGLWRSRRDSVDLRSVRSQEKKYSGDDTETRDPKVEESNASCYP